MITYYNISPVEFDSGIKATDTAYSDRLFQQNSLKFDTLSQEIFGNKGQYFSDRDHNKIEIFLSLYLEEKIILCSITRYENLNTGYPYWRFDYKKS